MVKEYKASSKLPKKEDLMKVCTKLWADCVKAKAGWKSELSGKSEGLHAHHLIGKPNYRLRFHIENGICLTAGEHFFVAHNTGREADFKKRVRLLRGHDIFERLEEFSHYNGKTDLGGVKVYLQEQLKFYNEQNELFR